MNNNTTTSGIMATRRNGLISFLHNSKNAIEIVFEEVRKGEKSDLNFELKDLKEEAIDFVNTYINIVEDENEISRLRSASTSGAERFKRLNDIFLNDCKNSTELHTKVVLTAEQLTRGMVQLFKVIEQDCKDLIDGKDRVYRIANQKGEFIKTFNNEDEFSKFCDRVNDNVGIFAQQALFDIRVNGGEGVLSNPTVFVVDKDAEVISKM